MKGEIIKNVEAKDKALIIEIERVSTYTIEEAESIWYSCPLYLNLHYKLTQGASIKDVAQFILNRLKTVD